jgi:hypothetical protein
VISPLITINTMNYHRWLLLFFITSSSQATTSRSSVDQQTRDLNSDTMSSTFEIKASPDTDIWRKPPSHDVFSGKTPLPSPPLLTVAEQQTFKTSQL